MLQRLQANSFRVWLLRVLLWLVPLCALWWWLGGSDWFLRVLSLLADAVLPKWVFADVREMVWQGNQTWRVRTLLPVESSGENLVVFISKERLTHMVLGFPLLWALLLATKGPKVWRMILGTGLLTLVELFNVASHLWAMLAVVVNHRASLIDTNLLPPPFTVRTTPYADWVFHLSSYAYYMSIVVTPLIAPVLVWVGLCQRGIRRLVVAVRRKAVRQRLA